MIAFVFCSLTIFLFLNFFVNVVTVPGPGGGATTEQDRVATHAAAGGSSHFSPPPKNARFVVEFHCFLL